MTSTAISPITASLYVAIGGATGAVLRYHLGRAVTYYYAQGSNFPWATFSINIVGSLCMGLLLGWIARSTQPAQFNESISLFLGVGLLGGFTTFSAFSAELITLAHRGHLILTFTYGSLSLVAGMIAFLIGLIAIQGLQ